MDGFIISDVIGQVGVEKLIKNGNLLPEISNSINRIVPFIEFTVHQVYPFSAYGLRYYCLRPKPKQTKHLLELLLLYFLLDNFFSHFISLLPSFLLTLYLSTPFSITLFVHSSIYPPQTQGVVQSILKLIYTQEA